MILRATKKSLAAVKRRGIIVKGYPRNSSKPFMVRYGAFTMQKPRSPKINTKAAVVKNSQEFVIQA
jgi:hypothetical protein